MLPCSRGGRHTTDLTPSALKEFAVRNFGKKDKLVLIGGMGVVPLGFAVLAGLLPRRNPLPGTVLAVALGGPGIAAVLARPDLSELDVLAPRASLVTGVVAFRVWVWVGGG